MKQTRFEIDPNRIHDNYFKFVFGNLENLRTFLDQFFPDVAKYIELKSIKGSSNEKISVEKNQKLFLDLIIDCNLKDRASKLYLLFEHKSNPDKRIFIQLAKYIISTWEEDLLNKRDLTPIIPIIFYHGKKEWKIPTNSILHLTDFPDELKRLLPNISYLLFDIKRFDTLEIKKRVSQNKILLCALELFRSAVNKIDSKAFLEILSELNEVILDHKEEFNEDVALFIKMSIIYIEKSSEIKREELKDLLLKEKEKDMKKSVLLEILEEAEREGLERGMQKGIQQGIQQGIEEGYKQALYQFVLNAYNNLKSTKKVAEIFGIDETKVKEILNSNNKE